MKPGHIKQSEYEEASYMKPGHLIILSMRKSYM